MYVILYHGSQHLANKRAHQQSVCLTHAQTTIDEGELERIRLRQHTQSYANHLQVL